MEIWHAQGRNIKNKAEGDFLCADGRFELEKLSQVKLLIINNAFCIVQRATAQSKIEILRRYGVLEAPPGFQAGWSDCTRLFLLSFCSLCLLI
jgi:hypothetical protein